MISRMRTHLETKKTRLLRRVLLMKGCVASNLPGQTILLGRQRLGWARKIEIEAKKANLFVHDASMVTLLPVNVKHLTTDSSGFGRAVLQQSGWLPDNGLKRHSLARKYPQRYGLNVVRLGLHIQRLQLL
jgi:hypothetical protein